jgi:hypothetical protein
MRSVLLSAFVSVRVCPSVCISPLPFLLGLWDLLAIPPPQFFVFCAVRVVSRGAYEIALLSVCVCLSPELFRFLCGP